jgi:hypothetical protein
LGHPRSGIEIHLPHQEERRFAAGAGWFGKKLGQKLGYRHHGDGEFFE